VVLFPSKIRTSALAKIQGRPIHNGFRKPENVGEENHAPLE
jgi:hypothetical protein